MCGLAGGDAARHDDLRTLTGLRHPAICAARKIAVVLIEKCVEALVLRRRQIEHREQFAITTRRLPESGVDQVDEILSRQLAGLEWLIHDLSLIHISEPTRLLSISY